MTSPWALPFNADKCVHLPIDQSPAVPLSLHDDAPISSAESTRDLGVFVTTNFKLSSNARLAVSRSRARLFHASFYLSEERGVAWTEAEVAAVVYDTEIC